MECVHWVARAASNPLYTRTFALCLYRRQPLLLFEYRRSRSRSPEGQQVSLLHHIGSFLSVCHKLGRGNLLRIYEIVNIEMYEKTQNEYVSGIQ